MAKDKQLDSPVDELTTLKAELKEVRQHLSFLSETIQTAASILDPDVVMEITMDRIGKLIKSEAWSLLLYDEDTKSLSFKVVMGRKVPGIMNKTLALGEGIAGWVAEKRESIVVNDPKTDTRFFGGVDKVTKFHTQNILCLPLLSRNKLIGVIEVLNKDDGEGFSDRDLELVKVFTEPAAVAIHNAQLFKKTEQLTVTDDCTKLYNARYLHIYLDNEIQKAIRYNYPVSLIFMDLDGFKSVNDNYGHLVGSKTLGVIGEILLKCVRSVDIVARYGGDEFTIVLPNTDLEGGQLTAERIRESIEEFNFEEVFNVPFTLTGSLGVSAYPENGASKLELMRKADQAMYAAKGKSKNAVVLAD